MAPYTSDTKIHGLHYLRVVQAARELIAACAGTGGAAVVASTVPQLLSELEALEDAVNKLCKFEAEGMTRGTLPRLANSEYVSQILARTESLLSTTAQQRDAARLEEGQVGELFSLDETPQATAANEDSDPFEL